MDNKIFLVLCVLAVTIQFGHANKIHGCSKRPEKPVNYVVKSPEPYTYINAADLPDSFDWRNVNGKSYTTAIQNQQMPKFCGSCWAHSTTSALSDRFKIAWNSSTPDIELSPQVLLDCGQEKNIGGCDGGAKDLAHKFMQEYGTCPFRVTSNVLGITDRTCSPYMATDYQWLSELACEDSMCRNCDRFGNCGYVNGTKYYVAEFGDLPTLDTDAMRAEIYARGPIVCGMYAHSDDFDNYKGGIITDPTVYPEITHDISVVGWGEEKGIPFWIVRNSYGTSWGENGWFRIERGTNCMLIETSCAWSVPKL